MLPSERIAPPLPAQRRRALRWTATFVLPAILSLGVLAGACTPAPPPVVMDPLPGAQPLSPTTQAEVAKAWRDRAPDEEVRTRHRREDGTPRYTNRLMLETSPYLRQHAHNPVDWQPWGDEAFETARKLARPVLLSIGYSTCHWCHVMEEESFEDEEIARFLNENYVVIKVDREQRPDLDSIYMTAVQTLTGRGGWPMTVWLTPDREPFYGGTYFPARDGDRGSSPGFLALLERLSEAYRNDAAGVAGKAKELSSRIRQVLAPAGQSTASVLASPDDSALEAALTASSRRFDSVNGGPRGAPKFPSAIPVRALLRHHRRSGNEMGLTIATKTLDGMAAGGIRDHLAGGFHRYSTDPLWRVPHFEKMLYDNALLILAYVEAWQATGRSEYADVARDTLAWVHREMTAPDGSFYSATDADSMTPAGKREEGWFFTWTPEETAALLGEAAARPFNARYGVTEGGNLDGRSVLYLATALEELAQASSIDAAELAAGLNDSRGKLLAARAGRPAPLRDDKILTAWNGLMISAAARSAIAFVDDEYREMASRAADAVLRDFAATGRLVRSSLGDRRQKEAFLDDYAFLEAALLDLYEAGDGQRRLEQAIALDGVLEREFEESTGGFFMTGINHDELLVRERPRYDGAEPSGNSVAILNLLRVGEITTDARYGKRAERALVDLGRHFSTSPLSVSDALVALDFARDTAKEVVLVTDGDRASLEPLLKVFGSTFVPNSVLLTVGKSSPASNAVPLTENKPTLGGKPTAYVCEGQVCDLPTTSAETFAAQLRRNLPLQVPTP